ncbi:MAG TPA: M90 family metallopeptidase [Polyangiaceae bacterium]|nr:M90 family metallopeptidase [Polyangiaceae bacterium]
MFLSWLEDRRRRRLLETPFPDAWNAILKTNLLHFSYLDGDEQRHLRELTQVFIAERYWEGCGGLELDDEIRVTIAGQACLLLLGLDHRLYRNVETILVYPSTVIPRRVEEPMFAAPVIVNPVVPLIGEAHQRGPVILAWDAVRRGGRRADGHNVVYHEFAHKIDMADGAVDGVPPVATSAEYDHWVAVCTREYEALRSRFEAGLPTLLDPYAGTNVGEFFAVATEYFFDKPCELAAEHPELYEVLQAFYRQDPCARERAARLRLEPEARQ